MIKTFTPYTYLIGWSKHNKWYYGSRSSNSNYRGIAHPDDLWSTYFTSSKIVKAFREQHGEPDIIQIRRTFKTANEAKSWEKRVLERIRFMKSKFLNQRFSGNSVVLQGEFHPMYGKTHSIEARKKISLNHCKCSGSDNSQARHIIIETPSGNKIYCYGDLKEKCKELEISYATVNLVLLAKQREAVSGSCVGYKVYYL